MATAIKALTVVVLLTALGLSIACAFKGALVVPTLILWAVIAVTWGWFRPTRIEASAEGFHLIWPWRRRMVLRAQITGWTRVSLRELYPMFRVGVGGLFGVFGWFWRPSKGWLEIYSTAQTDLVLLELAGGKKLLLSPEDPQGFLHCLGLQGHLDPHPHK